MSALTDFAIRIEAGETRLESLDFELPSELEASEPPEARGLPRDGVRLLVSHRWDDRVEHARFSELDRFLRAGDVLAINTSGTRNASLEVRREDGTPLHLHLSTQLPGGVWTVELRDPGPSGTRPFLTARSGERLTLPAGAGATLLTPYRSEGGSMPREGVRLWLATLDLPEEVDPYLQRYGFPIRYGYVPRQWDGSHYQTVYATEVGSAEMPSAGRAFTPELITRLAARGVQIAPLILHTGVASLEDHEPPYEEYYRAPPETARLVNGAHAAGRRVIAVGTTTIRALETVTDADGVTHAGEGWTRLVITPRRCLRSVDGLLTGLHEPRATHLAMLGAVAGREEVCEECRRAVPSANTKLALAGMRHLQRAYAEALRERYLWHEFGDLHLILE
jgi:S-adenosylmethionine:tRNA ribosyltransferase-isomerase